MLEVPPHMLLVSVQSPIPVPLQLAPNATPGKEIAFFIRQGSTCSFVGNSVIKNVSDPDTQIPRYPDT